MKKTSTILTISSLLSVGFSTLAFSSSASQFTAQGNSVNSAPELPVKFCIRDETWTRPSESEQINYARTYMTNPVRYKSQTEEEILQQYQWTNDFIVYTYYWVMEFARHLGYSGVWAVEDLKGFENCKDFSFQLMEHAQKNKPLLIQMWIFSHELQKVQWTGDRYLVTVKPTGQGVQIFQFTDQENDFRREVNQNESSQETRQRKSPTIEIIDETGSTISICQWGDRQNWRMVCR